MGLLLLFHRDATLKFFFEPIVRSKIVLTVPPTRSFITCHDGLHLQILHVAIGSQLNSVENPSFIAGRHPSNFIVIWMKIYYLENITKVISSSIFYRKDVFILFLYIIVS